MAKRHNNKGRSKGGGQYVPLPYAMLRHDTWRSLSGPAVKVFLELRSRYTVRGDGSDNNGALTLSLDEAARVLKIGKATAQRALRELEKAGFVRMVERGKWYGHRASEYAVTDRPLKGKPASRDWQHEAGQCATGQSKLFAANGVLAKRKNH